MLSAQEKATFKTQSMQKINSAYDKAKPQINVYCASSSAAGLAPVPGSSFFADIGIILAMTQHFHQIFDVSYIMQDLKDKIEKKVGSTVTSKLGWKAVEKVRYKIGEMQSRNFILKLLGKKAGEQAAKGFFSSLSAFGGSSLTSMMSYATMYVTGNQILVLYRNACVEAMDGVLGTNSIMLPEPTYQSCADEILEYFNMPNVQKTLKEVTNFANKKADEAKKFAEQQAKEVERKAREAAREAERKAREAAEYAERKAREAAREAERKAREAAREAERKAREAANAISNAANSAFKSFSSWC